MRISDWSSDVCSSDLQLVHAWDVLATMTPPEYSALRPYLAQSSGFQSYQYRQIEFALGNKNAGMLKPHAHRPDILAVVANALETPSLYDEALKALHRQGLPLDRKSVAQGKSGSGRADRGGRRSI